MASSYGRGVYGAGLYGIPDTVPVAPPIIAPVPPRGPAHAKHTLGIGPWSNSLTWRGAPNYGVAKGARASVPTIAMPPATTASLTLRLGAGSEARSDYDLPNDKAAVIEEMATDLWWRRRDPRSDGGEMLGRFNADNVDIASADAGRVKVSVTWVDYRSLLEDRMVMGTAGVPTAGQSTWAAGTFINEILLFALPTNTGIDISEATNYSLPTIKTEFELPPGTTIEEVMKNLQSISSETWEWWVEQPVDHGARPKLWFTTGERGDDNGVVLADVGGNSPIESWTMQASGSRYANKLYFTGAEEAVIFQNTTEIGKYGQRDAYETDSSLAKKQALITAAGEKKLIELMDRRPTFNVKLRPGFWQGRTHIDVGDWVTIVIALGAERIITAHRVTELVVELDSSGIETVSVTLGAPRPSRDPRSRASAMARLVKRMKNYEKALPTEEPTP